MKNIFFKYFVITAVLFFAFITKPAYSQTDTNSGYKFEAPVPDINMKYGDYSFTTKYDTSAWGSVLTVRYKSKIINEETFEGWIDTMSVIDFNGDGKKNLIISVYTGGAHCCVVVFNGVMENGKFKIPDTLFIGNAGYNIEDIDKDGVLELETASDMFAYAFTNYAETRFPPRFYRVKNNKFVNVTKNYPKPVNDYIKELKQDLKEFTDKGFECYGINDDTFNTDAGSVKTILAAITACYHSIGEVSKGYDLIDKYYKCPDKGKFVKILKDEFKLK
jgi:hypothetical protein